ncbi:MAG: LysR family transcriptional regulator [Deltaproteobacteria bacterium]|nr:MAG: LysR family transcriptional regulator [Deltaproteobacteria bacterium]
MSALRAINLNLLVALDALLDARSVGLAAQRVGVTQSAMSHTLRQLRELFDDPLLVRSGRAMVPTPRALALQPELRQALATLEGVVAHRGAFDPSRYAGTCTLATQDGVVAALAEALFRRFRAEAPLAELRIVRPPEDLARALEDGRIDVATAPPIDIPSGLVQEPIAGTAPTWSVVCCADHPLEDLDVDGFCAYPHAMMSLSGEGPSFVDHVLASMGRERRIAVRIPYLLALPWILPGTDMLSVVVTPGAEQFVRRWPLKRFDCPLPMPTAPMTLLWHGRYEADPAHRWFRGLLHASAEELSPNPG